jgi:hypothetical protein
MPTIYEMIQEYVTEDPRFGHIEERNGEMGIVFHDENEFIPLADLGYNSQLGFYRLNLFPDAKNEAI